MQAEGGPGVFCEAEQLLQTDADESHEQLAKILGDNFRMLCDLKQASSDQYYRLNDDKASAPCPCQLISDMQMYDRELSLDLAHVVSHGNHAM